MKSLPRTPCQSTAPTITATMMAKAFQNNHHKRGVTEMMAPPPTPTAQQQPSYLDCQSLQSSLKRVRLSSSPGELRLQRDLRHMVSSGTWVPKPDSSSTKNGTEAWMWHPPAPPVTVRSSQHKPPPHIELQQVESLRLQLTFQHSVVAWIQIPRMYPHRPPLISRIVYNNNNNNNHPFSPNSHQGIQSILVHEAPPMRGTDSDAEEDTTGMQQNNNSSSPTSIHCANTVVYRSWSPVQRLGDLLEFVISVFQEQQQEMYPEEHNNHHNKSEHDLTYSSSSLSSNSSWSNSRRSSNSSLTSATTATTSGYRTSSTSTMFPGWIQQCQLGGVQAMTMDSNDKADLSSFLVPNRFDMGYDRAISAVIMEVDTGIPQQVSMMDL